MGQQVYEEEIIRRAPRALGSGSSVSREIVRSMRSELPGTTRLPTWVLSRAPRPVRRAIGATMYRGADIVHRMGFGMPPARVPEIITIHDTVAWRFDDESLPEPFAADELRRAAAVIAPSQFAADDVAEYLGIDRVEAIHNGVDQRFFDAEALDSRALSNLGITGSYVLHAGGASKRKNLDALAEAWADVASARPDLTLVLSGPEHPRRTRLFAQLPRTRLLGRVRGDLIPGLLAGASAVVVPSLYEGFGLPALEAMAVGVPVVAARTSSLVEVVGDAGVLVEPSGAAIAEGLVYAASDESSVGALAERGRLRAQGFTWERSAAHHAEVWRRVAKL
ncbi:glycosyltransferase family 4 protein [Microbacterium sp. NPDC055357]